jgi:hypothetical protein
VEGRVRKSTEVVATSVAAAAWHFGLEVSGLTFREVVTEGGIKFF